MCVPPIAPGRWRPHWDCGRRARVASVRPVVPDLPSGSEVSSYELSIVVCVRDGADHLPGFFAQLRPLWAQSYELVLVDDASTDATGSIMVAAAREFGGRLLTSERSEGLGVAQARGVAAARGHWVWLIDCDDRFEPGAASALLQGAERSGADVVVGRAVIHDLADDSKRTLDHSAAPAAYSARQATELMLLGRLGGYTWNKLYRRTLFDGVDDLPLLATQPDFCRTASAVVRSERVELIDDVVYTYVRHRQTLMTHGDPPLQNLVTSRDHLRSLIASRWPTGGPSRALLRFFDGWFVALAAVHTPAQVDASASRRAEGRRIARSFLGPGAIVTAARVRPRLAAELLLVALVPRAYGRFVAARAAGRNRTAGPGVAPEPRS